jgi:DNA-binding NarL/FixJ family response regulator
MPLTCCFAGLAEDKIAMFGAVIRNAGIPGPAAVTSLNVSALGSLSPGLLLCDVDGLTVDKLEIIRQLRFVLPDCVIAVYTGLTSQGWSRAYHLAGTNCLLSKSATEAELSAGLRDALRSGCFTDPRFAA